MNNAETKLMPELLQVITLGLVGANLLYSIYQIINMRSGLEEKIPRSHSINLNKAQDKVPRNHPKRRYRQLDAERIIEKLRATGTVRVQHKRKGRPCIELRPEIITHISTGFSGLLHIDTKTRSHYSVRIHKTADGRFILASPYAKYFGDGSYRLCLDEFTLIDWCWAAGGRHRTPNSTISRFYKHPLCDFQGLTGLVFVYVG